MLPNIHILGIQGSGKGTQSALLVDRYHFTYLASGSLFRDRASQNDDFGIQLKRQLEAGILLSTQDLLQVVTDYLTLHPIESGLLGDGVIRNVEQHTVFNPLWRQYNLEDPFLIHLKLDDATARERIEKRQAQALANGESRSDETPAAINQRIALYHEVTEPVIDLYRELDRCLTVDAAPPINEVFNAIVHGLEEHFPQLKSNVPD